MFLLFEVLKIKDVNFYTLIAPFYDAIVGPFLRPARKDICREAEAEKCRRILDVACGTGEQAIMLAKSGMDVSGIDLTPAMLGIARAHSPPAVSYFLGNAGKLPFGPAAFDCVTVSLALHEMACTARIKVAGEMLRVLTPGGKLLVFDYAGRQNMGFVPAIGFLGLLERIAGFEHFSNFVQFTRMGGVDGFLEAFPLRLIKSRAYFVGALRLVIAEKRP
jgi:demethylmenaquinone methyltransferase/2-methoxy-6-polyprenyl-1,4-benzoquinol methylase